MKAVFEKDYDLRPSDFDQNENLLPSAILDIFQDAAGRHSVVMGAGIHDLSGKGLIWVVVKSRFEIVGKAHMYQTVRVKTWPLKPSRVTFRRECLLSDLDGNPLVRGSTEWVVVDKIKRRITLGDGIYNITDDEYLTDLNFEDKILKVSNFETFDDGFRILPRFSDIDINGHVNNTKYADYVLDAIIQNENGLNINYFQIDYHKEVLKDDMLRIHIKKENDEILALGKVESDIMFSCRIK